MAREARSKREWITADGKKAEQPEQAAGVRYTLLGGKSDGHTYMFDHLESTMDKWCGGWGFLTRAGNVANTVINSDDGDVATADEAIEGWIEDWNSGVYLERTAGGGAKVNRDALAQAVAYVMAKAGKTTFAKGPAAVVGKSADEATVRQLLEEDAKGLAVRYWRQIDDVLTRYKEIAGAPRKSVADM